jgi:hypothetical protein
MSSTERSEGRLAAFRTPDDDVNPKKKAWWLSYRKDEILGRTLRPEEAREVMNMARRIAAIVLMQPEPDANYRAVAAATYASKG